MWSIYALRATGDETPEEWIVVAGGYTSPELAARDIDDVRLAWNTANGFMIGMEVWRRNGRLC
jgi:hypothetical protein